MTFLFVIPFFKNSGFLKETLKSLLAQTETNWKAIVLDDSVDFTETSAALALVTDLQDERIGYAKNTKNLGMAGNWNQGLDLGKAYDFCVILHADDRLKKDYLKEISALAKQYPKAAGYFCRTEIIGSNGKRSFSLADFYKRFLVPKSREVVLQGLDGVAKLIPGSFVFCPTLCYRSSEIGAERFRTDLKMVLDFEFILRLLLKQKSWIGYYDHPLFEYRRHTANATAEMTRDLTRFQEEISLYRTLSSQLSALGRTDLADQAKKMRVVFLNLSFQMLKSLLRLRIGSLMREAKLWMDLL